MIALLFYHYMSATENTINESVICNWVDTNK